MFGFHRANRTALLVVGSLMVASLLLSACTNLAGASAAPPKTGKSGASATTGTQVVTTAPTMTAMANNMHSGDTTSPPRVNVAGQGSKASVDVTADVNFTLKTDVAEGKLVYIGSGGAIDGKVNPNLEVKPGQTVQITIINNDGALHDLTIPDLAVQSDQVLGKGSSSAVAFKADKTGEFAYFCSLPGHRQAGMEGKIVVGAGTTAAPQATSVSRAPTDLPGPIGSRGPQLVRVDLETTEVSGRLANGVTYTFWTFNGLVPGPFVRVRQDDTVEVHLKNSLDSKMTHSVDFHAVTGPGGGASLMQAPPGQEKVFTFKAINPGLFVYHCATPMVAQHISNGMYGMILVEPAGGLKPVDREFYVMQGELYTRGAINQRGAQEFDVQKLLDEHAEYVVFNGAVGALTDEHPLKAKVGETVRIFFGVGGPNYTSAFHVIGEVFDRVYELASLTSPPLTNVQTTVVPPGGATMVEFALEVPGRFILVDHALARLERGLAGYLQVEGPANAAIYKEGAAQ